ncbi:MAG TPA: CPBP family intramembrane glutamic endopeptidase [Polyangiaceae bacterium]|nr:CPBP family intramembrane glutamic endopeptidase [Polyangiaceae bacterium]
MTSLGVLCLTFIAIVARDMENLLRAATGGETYTIGLTGPDPANLVALSFSVAIAPLVEELVFRGSLFLAWRARWSPVVALLVSNVLFGACHKFGAAAFISGVTFTLLYTRTGSLWANVLCHSLTNAAWVAMGGLHYFWTSPQLVLDSPLAYGAFAVTLLTGTSIWIHFVLTSWQTLGAPPSQDSLSATPSASSLPAPPETLRAGRQLS